MANEQFIPITAKSLPVIPGQIQKVESKFPTEIINLPSKGWFYPPENPLSSGTLELKFMTAKEEDILTSPNLLEKEIVFDKLLESVIIDKSINLDEMLDCDRDATLFSVRRLAYGDEYNTEITCPRCRKENYILIDLGKMDNKPFSFDQYPRGVNNFSFVLPDSKIPITFKLLNKKDEDNIKKEVLGFEKISTEISRQNSTRLFYMITSVNGNLEKSYIRKFVNEELKTKDILAFKVYRRDNTPGLDVSFDFTCNKCGSTRKEIMPIGISFFWPDK